MCAQIETLNDDRLVNSDQDQMRGALLELKRMQKPLREQIRRAFPFAGILFEEYNSSITLSTWATKRLIPAGESIAFPMGTFDTFTTYGRPANLLEATKTNGLPLYARQNHPPFVLIAWICTKVIERPIAAFGD